MPTFNKVILIGNLTRDPELKYTSGGIAIAKFSLAVNYKTGKGDTKKEEVDFFDVEVWENLAEIVSKYLSKGSPVLIDGRLKQDRWTDESGKSKSRIKVVAQGLQFLGKGDGGKGDENKGNDSDHGEKPDNEVPF